MKTRMIAIGIMILLVMAAQVWGQDLPNYSSTDQDLVTTAKVGISFKLGGRKYKFANMAWGFWSSSLGYTIVNAFDSSGQRFVIVSFQGNATGTYSIGSQALYNQIQYHDVVAGYSWIAVGIIGSGTITVTECESNIGGYIKGKFNGVVVDVTAGTNHPISGSFIVTRFTPPPTGDDSAIDLFDYLNQFVEEAALLDMEME
jgi:hypothetical protein